MPCSFAASASTTVETPLPPSTTVAGRCSTNRSTSSTSRSADAVQRPSGGMPERIGTIANRLTMSCTRLALWSRSFFR